MNKGICRILFIGLLLAGGYMATSCSSGTTEGNTEYLAGNMMVVEIDGVNMFFLDNHDGSVSITYDQRNPMHTSSGRAQLTDYKGNLTVPAQISFNGKSYTVTGVTEAAFMNNTQLLTVTLPPTIKKIGEMAFYSCSMLTEANIPDGVNDLPAYCFQGCAALVNVAMPSQMNSIGMDAFKGCKALDKLVIPEGITEIIPEQFMSLSIRSLTLPSTLKSIGNKAFASCSRLQSVTIPATVIELTDSVFSGCSGLLVVNLPSTLTSLGSGAFYGCKALVEVTIPTSVKEIKPGCFCSVDTNGEPNWRRLTLNVMSEVPPKVTGTIANQTDRRRIVVPRGFRDVYLAADYWNEFLQVMERNYQ